MKLVKQDIRNIDRWLQDKGIKYMDIRYELMDHLITEYEGLDNYPDLESFLKDRLAWCKKVAKKKQSTIRWAYQKEVWRQLFGLIKNAKALFIMALIALSYFILFPILTANHFKWALFAPFFSVIIYQIYLLGFKCFTTKKQKAYISIGSLVSIFSLPQMFLYVLNMFPALYKNDISFLIPYVSFAVLLNIAAILAFNKKRNIVIKEYEFLKVYLA